jgi:hypothetical protein
MSNQPKQQVPSVGRVVHLQVQERCTAAIITEVYERDGEIADVVALTVFEPGTSPFMTTATQGTTDYTWHFPEYVPPR